MKAIFTDTCRDIAEYTRNPEKEKTLVTQLIKANYFSGLTRVPCAWKTNVATRVHGKFETIH